VKTGVENTERLFLTEHQALVMRSSSANTQKQGLDADVISIPQSVLAFFEELKTKPSALFQLAESIPKSQWENPETPEDNCTRMKRWLNFCLIWMYCKADHGSLHALVSATFHEKTMAKNMDATPTGSMGNTISQLIKGGKHPELVQDNFDLFLAETFKGARFKNGWKPNETKNLATLLSFMSLPLIGLDSEYQQSLSTMLELLRVFNGSKKFPTVLREVVPDGKCFYNPEFSNSTVSLNHEGPQSIDVSLFVVMHVLIITAKFHFI